MKIAIPVQDHYLDNKYGKHASSENIYKGKPICSFPIQVSDLPEKTKTLALALMDHDTVPLIGFSWIHWLACNIPFAGDSITIAENASQSDENLLQGSNSNCSLFGKLLVPSLFFKEDKKITQRYMGPSPRGDDHQYVLTLYALDAVLDLKEGFFYNELLSRMENHIVDEETVKFLYKVHM